MTKTTDKAFSGFFIGIFVMTLMIPAMQATYEDLWSIEDLKSRNMMFSNPIKVPPVDTTTGWLHYPRVARNPPDVEDVGQYLHISEWEGPHEITLSERNNGYLEIHTWEQDGYVYVRYEPHGLLDWPSAQFLVSLDPGAAGVEKYLFAHGVSAWRGTGLDHHVQPGGFVAMGDSQPIAIRPEGYQGPLYLHWGVERKIR